jgi:hypothetical protein
VKYPPICSVFQYGLHAGLGAHIRVIGVWLAGYWRGWVAVPR